VADTFEVNADSFGAPAAQAWLATVSRLPEPRAES